MPLAFSADRILDSLPDGVYVTDPERRILFWNQGAERITGYQPKDLLGKTCYDDILVHTDLRGNPLCGREYCPLHRSIVSGQSARVPLILFARTREGTRIPVQVAVSPIRDQDGQIVGGVEVFRDLSQLIQDLERASGIQKQAMDMQLPKDPRVEFALHLAPLEYVNGDFLRVERLDENRYGIMADAEYPLHTRPLQPGDTILIYSDGAVEQVDPEGHRLEEEGFLELLRQEGFPERTSSLARIEEALLQIAGTLFLGDDLSLLRIDVKTLG